MPLILREVYLMWNKKDQFKIKEELYFTLVLLVMFSAAFSINEQTALIINTLTTPIAGKPWFCQATAHTTMQPSFLYCSPSFFHTLT